MKIQYPAELPISAYKEEILQALKEAPVLILAGETGSGKTTQLPKLCLEAGLHKGGKIGCTQPRRVAAYSIAERIAEELDVELGQEVGVKVRFDDRTQHNTLIKVMTDGILLTEIHHDPLLRSYKALIIDEAHERSLNIDFILGYLRQLQPKRPDLKIIITSATIDTHHFAEAFPQSKVIQVEGRMYPVDVQYAPPPSEEADEGSIEWTAKVIEEICETPRSGDVLVFLPGERDIRELKDLLEGRLKETTLILPLFSRLSRAEQHKIFTSSSKRKIILATNIAETSITLPGIRYVVDSGLVRMSRYNPTTHTLRLPIEPIAQSAARQRQGRAGRVAEGICIRLYEEAEFLKRPLYPDPEIKRANLAEVILKMMAFGLGDIENFPFLEPPQPRAIKGGYKLLKDLGALDDERQLTAIGKQLARLPLDPTVGRMLLQAHKEYVMDEVLVIASGLSIQDPRERPFDAQAKADECHRKFVHPQSDFLTLLKIWDAYHESCEKLSQKALRNFCQKHYLSYMRMREWRDLHQQLKETLSELNIYKASSPATHPDDQALKTQSFRYRAIHHSLLTGLLTHVATREKGNFYTAVQNRSVMLFPGSALFDRKSNKKPSPDGPPVPPAPKTPQWIVCGEWMETSQLYARTVATIDPDWLIDIANHVLHKSYGEPFWDRKRARVLVKEKAFLYGLLVHTATIGYEKIDPVKACEIFIREALVADDAGGHFDFLIHNRKVREEAESVVQRLRLAHGGSIEETFVDFYQKKLPILSSVPDLFKFVRSVEPKTLLVDLSDLIDPNDLERANALYPKTIAIQTSSGARSYEFLYPSQENETDAHAILVLDLEGFSRIDPQKLEWMIPGYWEGWLEKYLWSLPKALRMQISPLQETIDVFLEMLWTSRGKTRLPLKDIVQETLSERFVDKNNIQSFKTPPFPLKIRVCDNKGKILIEGTEYPVLKNTLRKELERLSQHLQQTPQAQSFLNKARETYSAGPLSDWPSHFPPEEILIGEIDGIPVKAYSGLLLEGDKIYLHIFETKLEAQQSSVPAYRALLFKFLEKSWQTFEKECSLLRRLQSLYWPLGSLEEAIEDVIFAVKRYALDQPVPWPLQEIVFRERVAELQHELNHLVIEIEQSLKKALLAYDLILKIPKLSPLIQAELTSLIYPGFLKTTPLEEWSHLELYLKALQSRQQKLTQNPLKDKERLAQVTPWLKLYQSLSGKVLPPRVERQWIAFRWMIEAYKVSIFAQELKSPVSVSAKKLQEAWDALSALRA